MGFFDINSVSGLIPHGFCIKWTPEILWTYVVSDSLIALAYYSIPVYLAYYVIERKDLNFRLIYLMFSAFILACGTTHLMSIVLLWQPLYRLDAIIKVLTAIVSVATAMLLVKIMPHAMKLPSHEQLKNEIRIKNEAQLALQESEARLSTLSQLLTSLVEAIPDSILYEDADRRILIANQYAKSFFKLNDMAWQGKTYQQLAYQQPDMLEKQSKFLSDAETVWNSGQVRVFDEHILNDEGKLTEIEVRKVPIFTEEGFRKGMVVIGRDISFIRQVESELRIAKAIESQEGIIITDENNIILRVNLAFTRLTGYKPEEVIGQNASLLNSEFYDEEFYQARWRKLESEKFWQGEEWDKRKNGEIYPKWLTINVVDGPEGRISNYVSAFTDISLQKDAQEAKRKETNLTEQTQALQKADRRKDEFLAMLAHELRNPLAPIRNAVHILQNTNPDQSRIAWCSDVINRQVEQLVRLVDDLLDVSRISRGLI